MRLRAAGLVLVLALGPAGAGAKEWRLTAGASHPPSVPWVRAIRDHVIPESNRMLKELGAPERIVWTEGWSGTLYNFRNTLEGVGDGLADIGWVATLWEPAKLPLENVTFHAPFASADVHLLVELREALHRAIPALGEAWLAHNAVWLGGQVADSYQLVARAPLASVEALRGRRVLASGPAAAWLKGTGAIPLDVPLTDYYASLKGGAADAAIAVGSGILPFRLHEVAPHVVRVDLGAPIAGALAMNRDTWNSLPLHMKTLFRFLGRDYARRQTGLVAAAAREAMARLAKAGAKIAEFPPAERARWAKLLPDLAGDWAARNEAKGLPARKLLAAFMDGIRKRGGKPARDWDRR